MAKTKGKTDIAIKQFLCYTREAEEDARHELRALERVTKKRLKGCIHGGDAFVQLVSKDGSVKYHLTMPCARHPRSLECENALHDRRSACMLVHVVCSESVVCFKMCVKRCSVSLQINTRGRQL